MTETVFYPLANSEVEDQVTSEDFAVVLGRGMIKWREQGHLFPADALLLFRLSQASIPADLLMETMRLAAAICKGGTNSHLREIAKAALILFATEPSLAAKEIAKETGTQRRMDVPVPLEVRKVVNILHKINTKYISLAFADQRKNLLAQFEDTHHQHSNRTALKGNTNAKGKRWTWSKNKKNQINDPVRYKGEDRSVATGIDDDVQIFIHGKKYTLEQFMERTRGSNN